MVVVYPVITSDPLPIPPSTLSHICPVLLALFQFMASLDTIAQQVELSVRGNDTFSHICSSNYSNCPKFSRVKPTNFEGKKERGHFKNWVIPYLFFPSTFFVRKGPTNHKKGRGKS